MALISLPGQFLSRLTEANLRLDRIDFETRSSYTMSRQVLAWPTGHMWVLELSLREMWEVDKGEFESFLIDLEGRANTFQLPYPVYPGPGTGYSGPAGRVNGSLQTGRSLATDGWTPSAPIFRRGDKFTVNDELKVVSANVTANGSGQATVPFGPALRRPPPDNAQLEIVAPYVVLAAEGADVGGWGLRPANRTVFDTLRAVEAF